MSQRSKLSSVKRRRRKEQLAHRHGQHCAYCGVPFAELSEATLDHIAPYSVWRSWSVTSLVLACVDCNRAKADRFPLLLALALCAACTSTGVNGPSTPVNSTVDVPAVHVDVPVFTADSKVFTSTFTATGVNLASTPVNAPSTPVNVNAAAPTVQVDSLAVHLNDPGCRPLVGGVGSGAALTSVTTLVTDAVTPRDTGVSPTVSRGVSPVSPLVGAVSPIVLPIGVWRLLARLALAHRPVFTAVWRPDPIHRRSTSCLHESTRHARRTRPKPTRPDCLRAPRSARSCAGPTGEAVCA